MLEITNVSKYFHGPSGIVRALDGISVTVADGAFAAVQGPSGCGKTTLLLAAGGILAPDDGDVAVNGRHPYRMPPEERARFRASEIGFVFQRFHLIPYLSVLDNVLLHRSRARNDAVERAHELLRRFGLNAVRDTSLRASSTGERQRTALARALLNEPGIILATSQPATSTATTLRLCSKRCPDSPLRAARCSWSPTATLRLRTRTVPYASRTGK
jgi:ABC-type lipoprotein export system ATPase subunit